MNQIQLSATAARAFEAANIGRAVTTVYGRDSGTVDGIGWTVAKIGNSDRENTLAPALVHVTTAAGVRKVLPASVVVLGNRS